MVTQARNGRIREVAPNMTPPGESPREQARSEEALHAVRQLVRKGIDLDAARRKWDTDMSVAIARAAGTLGAECVNAAIDDVRSNYISRV